MSDRSSDKRFSRALARRGDTQEVEPPTVPGPTYILEPRSSGVGRRIFWFLTIVGLVVATVLAINLTGILPKFHNPFAQQTTVKQQPPLLLSIKDLNRFVAAEAEFQVVIDLKKDRKFVPDFLLNERTLFVADGTVQAYVDFSTIGQSAIKETEPGKSVEITLPAVQLEDPHLDLGRSYVFAEERGLINRVGDFFDGDPNRQQEVMLKAEDSLKGAADASELKSRAETNTRNMLNGLLHSLGYTAVVVKFEDAAG
ncbi:DUF4230 domain-containing protein [Hamadaea tsunoensis]|uniref:DUF4230 domain-containing protein n=1 Tax=Hamadaea tsunoensis TaxID=53368 RepID=UPI0004211BA2|nr:DUF4230 domain-containing protein [Hamadaea tsunoensis]